MLSNGGLSYPTNTFSVSLLRTILNFESLTFNGILLFWLFYYCFVCIILYYCIIIVIIVILIFTESKCIGHFWRFCTNSRNFPSFSHRPMWAVYQIHWSKHSEIGSQYRMVQHSIVLQTDLPGEIMTCAPSYPAFFRPSIWTCTYLGLNTPTFLRKKTSTYMHRSKEEE